MEKLKSEISQIQKYLEKRGWLSPNESIEKIEKPGEGNMNFTLRVYTSSGKTFIIKQSREYVEKYPSIAAPAHRALIEGRFYEYTQTNTKIKDYMPQLLGTDTENNIILTQDLGEYSDLTYLYQGKEVLTENEIIEIVTYLNILHSGFKSTTPLTEFSNREMRDLNHEHIFKYPFMEDNGFDLDHIQPGLQDISLEYKKDQTLKNAVENLGGQYLADGHYLLHGDYYFGSFLKTQNGIKIIDPEFCFYGPAEFDLGVLIAHLKMSMHSQNSIDFLISQYRADTDFNFKLLNQFVGVEIMRRIIGLAQLPLKIDLETKKNLLLEAKNLIIN